MKVLIVGMGSMGKRRARLLKGMLPDVELCGVDASEQRCKEAQELGIRPFSDLAQALTEHYDAALVCTAPLTHAAIIDTLLTAELPVFTELNLVSDGYEALLKKAREKNLVLFLSSTMLYRAETQYIKQQVETLYLSYWPVFTGLASVGKLQKLFCERQAHRRRARNFRH